MFNEIFETIKSGAKQFADASYGSFRTARVITHRNIATACDATIDFDGFYMSYVYHVGKGNGPKSVLSCLFYKQDDPFPLGYFAYDLLNIIDRTDFECYQYSFLPDVEAVKDSVDDLNGKLLKNIDAIKQLFSDGDSFSRLRDSKISDITEFYGRNIFEQSEQLDKENRRAFLRRTFDVFYSNVTVRFASRGYSMYLDGDKAGALKRYSALHHLTEYEKRLLEHLRSDAKIGKSGVPNYLSEGLSAQSGKGLFFPFFISWVFLSLVFVPLYFVLYCVFANIFASGAQYATACELNNAAFSLLPGFITSIAVSYFLQKPIMRLLSRSRRRLFERYRTIVETYREKNFMRCFLYTVIAASVIFTMLSANTGVRFYDGKIAVNATLTDLRPIEYSYSEIDAVYHFEGSYNAFGEWTDGDGTVVKMKDGKIYNLYNYADNDGIEKTVYPLLEKKGIAVTKIRSSEEIKTDSNG